MDPMIAEELDQLGARLRSDGWAFHVSVESLVRSWVQLASEVGDYQMSIDDYTNDVCSRDGLEIVLGWATPAAAAVIMGQITDADEQFKLATVDDGDVAVGRYFRVDAKTGWWWSRRPTTGPLAGYLDRPSAG